MFTKKFWKDAAERAVKTTAQTAAAVLGVQVSLLEVDWVNVGSVAGLAGLLSLLSSLASTRKGDSSSASLT